MGTPASVIKVLEKYQEAGVNQILCFMQIGDLAHARIMKSIALFAVTSSPPSPSRRKSLGARTAAVKRQMTAAVTRRSAPLEGTISPEVSGYPGGT